MHVRRPVRNSVVAGVRLPFVLVPLAVAGCAIEGKPIELSTSALIEKAGAADKAEAGKEAAAGANVAAGKSGHAPSDQAAQPGKLPVALAAAGPGDKLAVAGTAAANAPAQPGSRREYYVDFDPDAITLPDAARSALSAAVKANRDAGYGKIKLATARGGRGNGFDQAVIAQKRARLVNELLPSGMVVSQEFDPTLPEDTVRIEFISAAPANARKS